MSEPAVVLELPNATLWYHAQGNIIHHQIRAFIHGEAFHKLLETGVEQMILHKASKWLSDDRGNGAIKPEDGVWAQTVWAPKAVKAGWKSWALVLPTSAVGKMNMKKFTDDNSKLGIAARAFDNPEAALAWLQSV